MVDAKLTVKKMMEASQPAQNGGVSGPHGAELKKKKVKEEESKEQD